MCIRDRLANYPLDQGEGQDYGGIIHADTTGSLYTTVNMLQDNVKYQACYYKPTSGPPTTGRRMEIVVDTWTPVDAFVIVAYSARTADLPPFEPPSAPSNPPLPESPPPPPFNYYVMDACGIDANQLSSPQCEDRSATQGVASNYIGMGEDAGVQNYAPSSGFKFIVRCCLDNADGSMTCSSRSGGATSGTAACYTGAPPGDINGVTTTGITWEQARDICVNDGRRLCLSLIHI